MADDKETPADKFIGLAGPWKTFANLGIAGIIAGSFIWLLTVQLPSMNRQFAEDLRYERECAHREAEKSREHGNKAAKDLSEAIKEQTQILNWYGAVHQSNQEAQIELQKKLLKDKAK